MAKTKVMANFSAFGDEFPVENETDVLSIEPTKTYNNEDIIVNPNLVSTYIRRRKETDWTLSTG